MQLPTQRSSVRRNHRLHPTLGRFAGLDGITPSEDFGGDEMDDSGGDDDGSEYGESE